MNSESIDINFITSVSFVRTHGSLPSSWRRTKLGCMEKCLYAKQGKYIFTNLSTRAGYDTRPILYRVNQVGIFPSPRPVDILMSKSPVCPREKMVGFIPLPRVLALYEMYSLVWDLNSGRRIHFN